MKAFMIHKYGTPDVLHLAETDQPVPRDDEVLVRVRATSVQPYDRHHVTGEPYIARLAPGTLGLRGPKLRVLGADIAGAVEAVGKNVTRFQPGDEVFALVIGGGFAEYVCVRESELAPKPVSLSYEQTAAVPMAASTALTAIRDHGRVAPGHRVLINGASGGVGTFAVQLARALGAEVTAVCSARNADLVRSIGAKTVIDYAREDFTRTGQKYDVLLDLVGSRSGWACRRVMARKGTLVALGGPSGRWFQPTAHLIAAFAASLFGPHRFAAFDIARSTANKQNLETLTGMIDDGEVTPVIDRVVPFADLPEAVAYQAKGHARGKVVITI